MPAQPSPPPVDTPSVLENLTARARLLTLTDPSYPTALHDLPDAPTQLRIVGSLPELPNLQRTISIVGTRRADDEALDFAFSLARCAALQGLAVVSGGAVGIDRAAHEGAIDGGGSTVVVLPTGLDAPYPRANHDLFARAAKAGCLLTEAQDGADPRPGRFLKRNRLIAALGRSTVVVQAPARSGALSTARIAKRLGRLVLAVPASPWDPRGSGSLGLIRRGARICATPGDVLSETAPKGGGSRAATPKKSENSYNINNLSQPEQTILKSLQGRARHPDELCQRTGIPAFEVQQSILRLLVQGLVEERPGGRYKSCPPGGQPY